MSEPPSGSARPPGDPGEVASLRLGALEPQQRAAFLGLLRDSGVSAEVVGDEVRFPAVHRTVVQRLLLLAASDRPPSRLPADLVVAVASADVESPAPGGALGGLADPGAIAVPNAGLARRVAGAMVNLAGYLILTAFVFLVLVIVEGTSGGTAGEESALTTAFTVGLVVAPFVLSVPFVALAGGSPGMLLFGMQVVDRRGRRAGWGRSLVRAVVIWGPYLVLSWLASRVEAGSSASAIVAWSSPLWFVLLCVTIAGGPERRGWQDRAAGVAVLGLPPSRISRRLR